MMSFGLFMQLVFERLLQATGRTFYSMLTQLLGAILNIILDPIMIFGLFGFFAGAAAGVVVVVVVSLIFHSPLLVC